MMPYFLENHKQDLYRRLYNGLNMSCFFAAVHIGYDMLHCNYLMICTFLWHFADAMQTPLTVEGPSIPWLHYRTQS
jgi:hypothetical protein